MESTKKKQDFNSSTNQDIKQTLKTSSLLTKKLSTLLLMNHEIIFPEETQGHRIIVNGYQHIKRIELLKSKKNIDIDNLIKRLVKADLIKQL